MNQPAPRIVAPAPEVAVSADLHNDKPASAAPRRVSVSSHQKKGGKRGPRGGIYDPFPVQFHRMLDMIRDEGQEDVVSWLSHGRAFKIHQPKVFAASIMVRFFNQSKYTSFQRQLNLYGKTS